MNNNTNEVNSKACSKCSRELPGTPEYFYRNNTTKDGLRYECKDCHKPKLTTKKEHVPEGYKKCSECDQVLPASTKYFCRKKAGKYGLDSRCKKCDAEYRNKHKDRAKEYHRLNYIQNKEVIGQRNSEWHRKNKSSLIVRKQRRRARQRKLPATLTEIQWIEMKAHFNNECAYCGMTEEQHYVEYNEQLHQEHFIPLSNGGEYTHNNIIPSCRKCNASKHDGNFFEWYPAFEKYDNKREKKILEYLNYNDKGIQQLSIL